jgi:catechol 2,3-dioxygenase-like lactoylglutathione lyase family enzyme
MKIDHVNIVVSDMDRSIAFYTRLGLIKTLDTVISGAWVANVIGIHDENLEARVVFMDPNDGTARLEMIQYIVPQGQAVSVNSHSNTIGVRHFALVVDDLAAIYRELLQEGVTFFSEPQEVTGNKAVEARIGRKNQVYLLDPDGIIVELAHYRPLEL